MYDTNKKYYTRGRKDLPKWKRYDIIKQKQGEKKWQKR